MFRKLILLIIPFLAVTVIFLLAVIFMNRQGGRGALQVTSKPVSQVFLDGEYIGNTPLSLMELPELISAGEYTLKLVPTSKGYSSWEEKINIYNGSLTVVDRTFEENPGSSTNSTITLTDISDKNKAELLVISFPKDAQVVVDNDIKGNTPILINDITASDHEIKILKDGYREKALKVKALNGKRLEISVGLGIRTDLIQAPEASDSANIIQKVRILETPTGFLRVRASANLGSEQIGLVDPGDEFELISEEEDWFQIKISAEESGWVSSQYSEKI